jgi:iron complex outermembrane receptor protein
LNLEIIENIEVIRGTSSSLYGNSSAGVIKIKSVTDFENNFSKIAYSLGSNNQAKKQAFFGVKKNNSYYTFLVSETKSEGYREFRRFQKFQYQFKF